MPDLVFMGTPAFAVPSLRALVDAGYRVKAAVTQPDKPAGRGQKLQAPAVKLFAQECGIPVLQPGRLRKEPESVAALRESRPDAIVVVAFGQILPQDVLDIPPLGCINVHGSLLPAYRGAGPIQWALINGERLTGVTTMLMDAGMDTGPMFLKAEMPIQPEDDAGSLGARMAEVGAKLLIETLEQYFAGGLAAVPQPADGVSMAPMLKKEDGLLDWSQPAGRLHDRIRGLTPWPGAYTTLAGEPVKVHKAEIIRDAAGRPGELLDLTPDGWVIGTCQDALLLRTIQLPGRRPQEAAEAARGLRHLAPGRFLGSDAAVSL
ncbi:MAG: methionyl-tRNA formyltransferase [Candidatus Sericytochromatia bacterium]|nr:methionyl-tRNA formyltransferase [Candidatus Tanganyikabacteria bacterium]